MRKNEIQNLKKTVERYMFEDTGICVQSIEMKAKADQSFEAGATALVLDAYLLLSNNINPDYAIDYLDMIVNDIERLRDHIIHDEKIC